MKEAEVVASELVKTREAAPEVFEFTDKTFDEVGFFVKLRVVVARVLVGKKG